MIIMVEKIQVKYAQTCAITEIVALTVVFTKEFIIQKYVDNILVNTTVDLINSPFFNALLSR